jgi:hypothetical protein
LPAELNLDWTHAWGLPAASGLLRCRPEDFEVEEQLSFTPGGEGEHAYLFIENVAAIPRTLHGNYRAFVALQSVILATVASRIDTQ